MNTVGFPRSNNVIKSRIPVPVKTPTCSNLNKYSKNVLHQKSSLLQTENSNNPAERKEAYAFQKNIHTSKLVPGQNKVIDTTKYKPICRKGGSNPKLQMGTFPMKTGQIRKSVKHEDSKIGFKTNKTEDKSVLHNKFEVKQTDPKYVPKVNGKESYLYQKSQQNKNVQQIGQKIGNKVKENGSLYNKTDLNKNAKQAAVKVTSGVNKKGNIQKADSKTVTNVNIRENDSLHVRTEFDNIKKTKFNVHNSIQSKSENTVPSNRSHITAQKDLKFEASDIYRNMILSNKPLSPSMLKLQPGVKLSYYAKRSSAYQKPDISADPLKDALREIENLCLSVKRNSSLAIQNRPPKLPMSPFQERNSFYTPCTNPKAEVMRSLEKMRIKNMLRKAKSEKKVTFNLNIEDHKPKIYDVKPTPFRNECRLTNISENSKENTPNSPQNKVNEANSNNTQTSEKEKESSTFSESNAASIIHKISDDLAKEYTSKYCDISLRDICVASVQSQRTINFQPSVSNGLNGQTDKIQAKLYAPQPASIFCKSSAINISSPEFLMDGSKNGMLAQFAPICTPLVLKSMAKSIFSPEIDLSPVRIKLDFTEEEDTPKKDAPAKNYASVTVENIATIQKKLDGLADKECSMWLQKASIQMICGRNLENPVALVLNEGDEMHFLPIKL